MSEHRDTLRTQSEWQRAQADLSWPAKVRIAESVRESVAQLRRQSVSAEGARRDRLMTARIVPLGSDDAGDARVAGTATERLAILADLSRRMWELTKRPPPSYTRKTMPVKATTLADQ